MSSAPAATTPWWSSLTVRLLLGQLAVLAVGLIIVIATAVAIGPSMFHRELVSAGHAYEAYGLIHLEDALRSVIFTALGIAVIPALGIAGAVSVYLYRTIGHPVSTFSAAAKQVASGNYEIRVTSAGLGPDFDSLADSFNDMAVQLNAVDTTRDQMLADLAHEMRTPLASLRGYLEGIDDGVVAFNERTKDILHAQVLRLERLAQDMRSLNQAEEAITRLKLVHQEPSQLAAEAVDAVEQVAADHHITITTTSSGPQPALVRMDPDRMGQVLSNLLENALRHTPEGGTIAVHTDHTPQAVTITVTDNGEGIAPEHLPHVFERFYRAYPGRETSGGSSGLGLAISKAIVEAHGGRLEASSPGPGHGASFRIHLPRATLSH
ncbi:sensor histidine kinase [Corynebacterium halotolerans]|uniref:Sensor-like histidine kinase SenX3 n=1 Tax=Corynebacterium halotolerans YIM 70093 = DSM 44683 TaxID=1121362 RepID=M1NR35_9CORY|nr:HAMP domain-containing sensor histidine kinase [Corynebacterium halotolerans]AGF73833.1 histidine kinase [Corynebacterium halotolerans YIM 70093 = DSM 44683]